MSYYTFTMKDSLKRPESITTNITYPEASSNPLDTVSSSTPFIGQDVHDNFFNLAKSVIDDNIRLGIVEKYPQSVNSSETGFVSYSGKKSNAGNFYGGEPLSLPGSTNISIPYNFSSGNFIAFRLACNEGIIYTDSGINSVNTIWKEITYDTASNFTNINDFISYLNLKLKYEEKTGSNVFTIQGSIDPSIAWDTTFKVASSTFNITVNDRPTPYEVTISQINIFNISTLVDAIQLGINNAIGVGKITVSNSGNMIVLTGNPDRTTGGLFSFKVAQGLNVGPGNWLGLFKDGTLLANSYDLTSLISFSYTGTGPYNIVMNYSTISGHTQPDYTLAIWDKNAAGIISGLMNSTGGGLGIDTSIGTSPKLYYHTLHPLSSYTNILNYGGDFYARDGYFRKLTLVDSFDFVGTTNMENLLLSGALSSNATTVTSLTSTDTVSGISAMKLNVSGPLSVTGNSIFTGDVTIGDNVSDSLIINSTSTFNSTVNIPNSALSIGGGITFSGSTGSLGTLNASTINVSNFNQVNSTISGTLTANTATVTNLNIMSTISTAGKFDVGTTPPAATNLLQYNGYLKSTRFIMADTVATGSGTGLIVDGTGQILKTSSDARLKKDINPLPYGLKEVIDLNPVSFFWKDNTTDSSRNIGFIAQELKKIIPESVFGEEENTYLSINSTYLIPVLVKAIQELTKRIELLENN